MRHLALRFPLIWWQTALAIGLSVLGAVDGAHAEQRASGPRIVVTGEGEVGVAPDIAQTRFDPQAAARIDHHGIRGRRRGQRQGLLGAHTPG